MRRLKALLLREAKRLVAGRRTGKPSTADFAVRLRGKCPSLAAFSAALRAESRMVAALGRRRRPFRGLRVVRPRKRMHDCAG